MESSMAESSIDSAEGLRTYELPAREPCREPVRVVGPGRLERGYLQRLSGLSAEIDAARDHERRLQQSLRERDAALEVSQRVERGCQRRIDRLETWLEQRTQALLESERGQKRLALALGSMQRELEQLRTQSALALSAATKPRPSLWRRLLGGGR